MIGGWKWYGSEILAQLPNRWPCGSRETLTGVGEGSVEVSAKQWKSAE